MHDPVYKHPRYSGVSISERHDLANAIPEAIRTNDGGDYTNAAAAEEGILRIEALSIEPYSELRLVIYADEFLCQRYDLGTAGGRS